MKISVITVVLNSADTIARTIESVVYNQPGLDYEYIIIDGGSTDGTIDVIYRYKELIHRIIIEPDDGFYFGLDKGLKLATGEVMCWINSGDFFLPGSLLLVHEEFHRNPHLQWITTSLKLRSDTNGRITGYSRLATASKNIFLIGGNIPNKPLEPPRFGWIQQESTLWRRSLFLSAGGYINTTYRLASDFELWSRFFHETNLELANFPIGVFEIRPNQLSSNAKLYNLEAQLILREIKSDLSLTMRVRLKCLKIYYYSHLYPVANGIFVTIRKILSDFCTK